MQPGGKSPFKIIKPAINALINAHGLSGRHRARQLFEQLEVGVHSRGFADARQNLALEAEELGGERHILCVRIAF